MEEGTGGKRLSYTSLPHPLKENVKIQKTTEARVEDALPWKSVCGRGWEGELTLSLTAKVLALCA